MRLDQGNQVGRKLLVVCATFVLVACGGGAAKVEPPADEADLGPVFSQQRIDRGRLRLILEHPSLLLRFIGGDTFGGESSRDAAMHMFSRNADAIEDVRKKTKTIEVAPKTWLVRLPIVNAAVLETSEGLVVVDTGYGPGGPALLEAIRKVSDKPVHTIIYTHGHVDHAYGTWAFIEAGEKPQIIAQEAIEARFDRYIRLRGSLAKYMSQPVDELPKSRADIVWPTRLFRDELTLEVGGETFVLKHHRGETDDQLYVWVPGRKVLVSADYYQGFLPNAGNGKRSQRYVEDWTAALREMATLGAEHLLPAHGAPINDAATISANFNLLAAAFEHITTEVFAGLNRGLTHDQIIQSITWPEPFASAPSLSIEYVTPRDIAQMLLKQYAGWWDDVPSHWSPASLHDQGQALVAMAGGMTPYLASVRKTAEQHSQLALHLIDWAYYAEPNNPEVQALTLELYKARVLDKATPTQEALAYFDHMSLVRALMLEQAEQAPDVAAVP